MSKQFKCFIMRAYDSVIMRHILKVTYCDLKVTMMQYFARLHGEKAMYCECYGHANFDNLEHTMKTQASSVWEVHDILLFNKSRISSLKCIVN